MDQHSATEEPRAKIPIGIPSLDSRLKGGIRPGTTILAIGPFGTGYNEFLRTAAIMHGNWQAESGLFDLEYGDVDGSVQRPSQLRYISVVEDERTFRRHIHDLAADDIAYPALENISSQTIFDEVANLAPTKPSQDSGLEYKSEEQRANDGYEQVFQRLDELIEAVPGEMVFLDAISDFFPITAKFLEPTDFYFISQTLCRLSQGVVSDLTGSGDDTDGDDSCPVVLHTETDGKGTTTRYLSHTSV